MKKIMFNDRYGLTEAVLSGRKTQTRRIVNLTLENLNTGEKYIPKKIFYQDDVWKFQLDGLLYLLPKENLPKYKVGEVVAVAQSYKDAGIAVCPTPIDDVYYEKRNLAGWANKIFTKPSLLPHHIRITNVRVERLQDISDEDCIKEGITSWRCGKKYFGVFDHSKDFFLRHTTPREAYAGLIDKISGKGVWDSNPWVFVYDFELVSMKDCKWYSNGNCAKALPGVECDITKCVCYTKKGGEND